MQTTASPSALILGVDVGKDELVVSLFIDSVAPAHEALSVPNTPAGLTKLQRWCAKRLTSTGLALSSLLVVMEATNVYWEKCAHHFYELGCSVSVVNPAQVKFFAKSTLRRGKTDAMDAQLIAQFGAVMRPDLWQPPSLVRCQLKALVREREAIGRQIVRERNHLKAMQNAHSPCPLAVRLVQSRLRLLERQEQSLEEALRQVVHDDAGIQEQMKLLQSVPGLAFIAALTILVETDGFERLDNGHQISAYSGLAPAPHQSGLTNRKGRISKVGNARLRRIAYLAALGARLSHSPFRAFYESLRAKGKPPKVALVAVARKLLRVALAVIKSGTTYQCQLHTAKELLPTS